MFTNVEKVTEIYKQENGLSAIEITVPEETVIMLKLLISITGGVLPKTVGKLHDGTVVELYNVQTSIVSETVIKMEFNEQEMVVLEDFNLETFLEGAEEEQRKIIEELSYDEDEDEDEDDYYIFNR